MKPARLLCGFLAFSLLNIAGAAAFRAESSSRAPAPSAANRDQINIDEFQAVGDGVTDDSAPLVAALAALGSQGGFVTLSCAKNYFFGQSVVIPPNVALRHCRGAGWRGNPGADWKSGPITAQPHIRLASTATIELSSNSGFEGVIFNAGLTFPTQSPADYAGTALKFAANASNDVRIDAMIVGFAVCFDGSAGGNRYHFNIECDANPPAGSAGVILGRSFDSSDARIRAYPWGTAAFPHAPQLTRSGVGIWLAPGPADDVRLDLFDYGHERGVVSNANGNIHFGHIWTDNNASYGVEITHTGASAIDALWLMNTKGLLFNSVSGNLRIGYIECHSGSVPDADCVNVSNGDLYVGHLQVAHASRWAVQLGRAKDARFFADTSEILKVDGAGGNGKGPYIVGPKGWTADQVKFVHLAHTDLAPGEALIGAAPIALPVVASAETLLLPPDYDHFQVTGGKGIRKIAGGWGDRRIILTFSEPLTVASGGNLALAADAPFTARAGGSLALWFDQTGGDV
ncbi:MAG: hypothetical protein N2444_05675, partial [Methylocystis sp.]|nr:hypothetical protein [Methylocystis sp.]